MSGPVPHAQAATFLRGIDGDWDRLVGLVGPCLHDPKAAREPYEALIRAVAYQQLAARAGDAIIGRLKAAFSRDSFPRPAEIIAVDHDALRACGFSGSKIATLRAIAEGALSGLVPARAEADGLSDAELIQRLTTIRGIGRWSVEMLLMYSLERQDVLPVDDLGIREGYRILKSLVELPRPKVLHEIGKAWSPCRTVASWYLWRVPRTPGKTTVTPSRRRAG